MKATLSSESWSGLRSGLSYRRTAAARRRDIPGNKLMASATQDNIAYEVDARVARQAAVRAYQRDGNAPLTRPLRIYTLDPSVSDRVGGVATVQVPYEKLEKGPIGSLFE